MRRWPAWALLLGVLLSGAALGSSGDPQRLAWGTVQWEDGAAYGNEQSGRRVPLTLDEGLQTELRRLLVDAKSTAAAAVVVDVATGAVLAATEVGQSSGSLLFDPVAPAASVFKLVTTAALYERTSVTPTTRVCTAGGLRSIERAHLAPAEGTGTVCVPFAQALGTSRNAAFAQLANQELMRDDLRATAEALGFNRELSLDVRGRVGTLTLPYNDLEFARAAAGFSSSRLSVFGGAQLALTVASGGLLVPMHFRADQTRTSPVRVLSERTATRLVRAMEVTVHSGTARESFVDARGHGTLGPIQAAGKTGTLKPDESGPTSSWFVGFAPSRQPRVVVAVLLQNPDQWHKKAHRVARDLFAHYFAGRGVAIATPH